MSIKSIAFFNNKGGVGKTSLVYHLSSMYAERDRTTLVVDLDPQSNLSSMFLDEEQLEILWEKEVNSQVVRTIYDGVLPLIGGVGDIKKIEPQNPPTGGNNLYLIPGSLQLSKFEDALSETWHKCLSGDERAFRVTTAFHRIIQETAQSVKADLILIDVGPNLGALNRSALIASEYVVIPLSPDLFSLQGLKNLGPTLEEWRKQWAQRKEQKPSDIDFPIPNGKMEVIGYVITQYSIRSKKPVNAYEKWMRRIPDQYRESIIQNSSNSPRYQEDQYKLALLKHYRSLMPIAMEHHKPMFSLKAAEGVFGAHTDGVKQCYQDFENLSQKILEKIGVE